MVDNNIAVPSFISKTYDIFNSYPVDDCCGWGSDGKTIVIKKIEVFAANILPRFFKHSNFQSFVRQLHIYDFHKTSTLDPTHVGYANEFFRQDKPDLLPQIRRKANTHPNKLPAPPQVAARVVAESTRESRSSNIHQAPFEAPLSTTSLSQAAYKKSQGPINDEINQLKMQNSQMKNDFDDKWGLFEGFLTTRLNEHENNINDLRLENRKLRDIIVQMKTKQKKIFGKWERLMHAVYALFVPTNVNEIGDCHVMPPVNWSNFDHDNFQNLMNTASAANKAFFSSVENDANDILALTNTPADELDLDSEADLGGYTSVSQPYASVSQRKEGMPLSYSMSFDAIASKVMPPVPKYPESSASETIGGDPMSRQSSFELFSTYVNMYGQPLDAKVNTPIDPVPTTSSSSKRPFGAIDQELSKKVKTEGSDPILDVGDEDFDRFAKQPSGEGPDLSLDSIQRYNSLDFGPSNFKQNSVDRGNSGNILNSPDPLSLSRYNSFDFKVLSRTTSENEKKMD